MVRTRTQTNSLPKKREEAEASTRDEGAEDEDEPELDVEVDASTRDDLLHFYFDHGYKLYRYQGKLLKRPPKGCGTSTQYKPARHPLRKGRRADWMLKANAAMMDPHRVLRENLKKEKDYCSKLTSFLKKTKLRLTVEAVGLRQEKMRIDARNEMGRADRLMLADAEVEGPASTRDLVPISASTEISPARESGSEESEEEGGEESGTGDQSAKTLVDAFQRASEMNWGFADYSAETVASSHHTYESDLDLSVAGPSGYERRRSSNEDDDEEEEEEEDDDECSENDEEYDSGGGESTDETSNAEIVDEDSS